MTSRTGPAPTDPVLDAMRGLAAASRESIDRLQRVIERADEVERLRRAGTSWSEIVSSREGPLIVELLRDAQEALTEAGARLRREEAQALHNEGITMDQIAEAFGVTRQRISALLREARASA
jgi:predicted transcriptional regulator